MLVSYGSFPCQRVVHSVHQDLHSLSSRPGEPFTQARQPAFKRGLIVLVPPVSQRCPDYFCSPCAKRAPAIIKPTSPPRNNPAAFSRRTRPTMAPMPPKTAIANQFVVFGLSG